MQFRRREWLCVAGAGLFAAASLLCALAPNVGMLIFALLAVFIAGLMVGRTPEYLGKKIESYDVKLSMPPAGP